jgi:hypothetical protein
MSRTVEFLFWNDKKLYDYKMRGIVIEAIDDNGGRKKEYKMSMVSTLDNFFHDFSIEKTLKSIRKGRIAADVLVRRDEHGTLWGGTEKWKSVINECYALNIKPMFFDFGYFDHYDSFMIDHYNIDGRSDIFAEWSSISDVVNWEASESYIQKYRNNFLKNLKKAKEEKPLDGLKEGEYVVIWPQYSMDLLRKEFKENLNKKDEVTDWINNICKIVLDQGLIPVVKGGPAMHKWSRLNTENVKDVRVFTHTEKQSAEMKNTKFEKDINYKLIAHAKYHIVSCSSVTNELVLANAPVVAMGKSWFTGLDIFNEPNSWGSLTKNATEINTKNRNKWINWWLSRQVKKEKAAEKFFQIYKKYSNIDS